MKNQKIRILFAFLAVVFVLPAVLTSCFTSSGEGAASETSQEVSTAPDSPDIPSGYDYVLTEDDLALINSAWNEKYNVQMQKYRLFTTVEEAMKRNSRGWYYLGKYGDTVVIWYSCLPDVKCCFEIEGYSFDFYEGTAYFFDNGVLYDNTDFPEDILTAEQAKELHDAYSANYLPLVRKDFAVLEYMPDLEIPTDEEMKDINDAYEQWYFDVFISHYSEDKAAAATKEAYRQIGCDPHRFFNDSKFKEYHYYGKVGGKVFIAAERTAKISFTAYDVAGFSFVYSGIRSAPLVYTDGVVTELSEAYRKGIVTYAEVAEMHERYLAYYYYFAEGRKEGEIPAELQIREYDDSYKSPIELTSDEIREIAWEYIDNEKNLKYEHGVRCYGKFEGGAYAVMIDGPYMYLQALETERVAGYEFYYNNSQKIRIYKDGVFYWLNEAYLMGIISESEVASIQWEKSVIQD